jgi:hypothetical protein
LTIFTPESFGSLGIPRPIQSTEEDHKDEEISELDSILNLPVVSGVMPAYDHETENNTQISIDCLWADPADDELEEHLEENGFGESRRY